MGWFKMKSTMCRYMDDLHAPNVGKMIWGAGMTSLQSSLRSDGKGGYLKGGTWLGCWSWQECKLASQQRCQDYGTLSGLGAACGLLLLVSAASAGMGTVYIGKERYLKKK